MTYLLADRSGRESVGAAAREQRAAAQAPEQRPARTAQRPRRRPGSKRTVVGFVGA